MAAPANDIALPVIVIESPSATDAVTGSTVTSNRGRLYSSTDTETLPFGSSIVIIPVSTPRGATNSPATVPYSLETRSSAAISSNAKSKAAQSPALQFRDVSEVNDAPWLGKTRIVMLAKAVK